MVDKFTGVGHPSLVVMIVATAMVLGVLTGCVEPVSLLDKIEDTVADAKEGPDGAAGGGNGSGATLTVSYDGNEHSAGTVPVDGSLYSPGDSVTVLGNSGVLTRTDYLFIGWNTEANGTGTTYQAGATFTIGTENIVLYARWSFNPVFFVSYLGSGNDSGTVPTDTQEYLEDATVTIRSGSSMGLTGHSFAGWDCDVAGDDTVYQGGDTYSMPGQNVSFHAVWTPNTYTIQYDGHGADGGAVPSQHSGIYDSSVTVKAPGSLSRYGYSFVGWNVQENGGGAWYDPGELFTVPAENTVMYAQWDPYTVGDPGPAGGTIFYVDTTGSYSGWDFLEVAPFTTEWEGYIGWGEIGDGTPNLATSTAIGSGRNNTDVVISWLTANGMSGMAAQLCDGLDFGGETDWFLPSKDELNLIYQNIVPSDGSFRNNGYYWSSSDYQSSGSRAWAHNLTDGWQGGYDKAGEGDDRVRAIRSF